MIFRRFALLLFALAVATISSLRAQPAGAVDLAATKARAEQGDVEAANLLGNLYTNAQGVPRDFAEALKWYQRAAEKGFAPAQFNLGLAHELGRGVAQDEPKAFQYYQLAAGQGFPAALFNVGNMYATGRGVKQDLFEANLWFKQAADKGILEAQFNLGLAYEEGRGVKKDESQAVRWYRQAADRGFARAQYNLGLLLEDGRGVEKNLAAAAALYQQAALAGHAPAMNNLGLMYSQGRGGLPGDPVLAYAWLSLAVENGVAPAARDFVGEDLSPEQRSNAGQLALDLKRRVTRGAGLAFSGAAPAPRAPPPAADGNVRELADALAEAKAANARFAEANQRLEVEQAQLERKLAQESSESRTLIENLRRQSERLQTQTQQALGDKAAAEQNITALGAQLRDAQAELTRVRESASARTGADPAELAKAQDAARRLTAEKDAASREAETLRGQLQAAQNDLRAAREAAARPQVNDEIAERLRQMQSQNRQLQTANDGAAREVAALTRQLGEAQGELGKLRASRDSDRGSGEELDKLQARVTDLRQANERLEKDLQVARSQPPAASAVGANKTPTNETEKDNIIRNLQRDNQRLNDDVKRSTRELLALNQQLRAATRGRATTGDTAPAASDATVKELADLQAEYSKLKDGADEAQARARRLEQELQTARTASAGQEEALAQLAEVRRELADSSTTREQLAARLAAAEQRAQSLEAELTAARQAKAPAVDTAALQRQLGDANDRISTLRADLDKAQVENAGLAAQVESAKEDVATIRARLKDAQAGADEAGGLRRQVADLSASLEQRDRELAVARQAATSRPTVDPGEIERLREDNRRLRTATDEGAELRAGIEQLRREKNALEAAARDLVKPAELRAALAQVEELMKKLSEADAAGDKSVAAVAELTDANEKLRQELETARIPRVSASSASDRRELDAARAQIEDLQGQIARLQSSAAAPGDNAKLKVELAAAHETIDRNGAAIAELTASHESLQKDLANAQKSLAAALAAQNQAVDAAKGEAYQVEIQTLTNRVKQLEAAAEEGQTSAAKEISSLAQQLSKTRETNRALVEANRALLQSKAAEKSFEVDELAQAREKLRAATATAAASTEANQKLTAELTAARLELEQAQALAAGSTALSEENRAIRARLAEFERATETTSSSVAELTGANAKLEQELGDLRQRADRLQTENTRLMQDLRGAAQTANSAGAQLAAMRRDVENARAANATLVESTAAQERERAALLAQLREDNRALTVRLNQAQGVLDQIASAARLGTPASTIAGGAASTVRPTSVTTAPAAAPSAAPRTHVIAEGDSLSKISLRYYGTAARWQEIFEANRDVLQGANALRVGQQLRIP